MITFGIVSNDDTYLTQVIDSIRNYGPVNSEIIVVGESNITDFFIKYIPSNDKLTVKKNIITDNASYDYIVYMHNYVVLCENWHNGFLKFGFNFDVCCNVVIDYNNARWRDWCLNPWLLEKHGIKNDFCNQIPYNITDLYKYQYINGTYWVANKKVMQNIRLNEGLDWGSGEDIEWSERLVKKYKIVFNEFSTVKLIKDNKPIIWRNASSKRINEVRSLIK